MCPRCVRGRLFVLAVQTIVALHEAPIANMTELALLVIAFPLVETETDLGALGCGPWPFSFRLSLSR